MQHFSPILSRFVLVNISHLVELRFMNNLLTTISAQIKQPWLGSVLFILLFCCRTRALLEVGEFMSVWHTQQSRNERKIKKQVPEFERNDSRTKRMQQKKKTTTTRVTNLIYVYIRL